MTGHQSRVGPPPSFLPDFTRESFHSGGIEREVFWSGAGPAVLVIAEMPGLTPKVARFARIVRDAGFTVALPHLFGPLGLDYGDGLSARETAAVAATFAASIGSACVRRDFVTWATGRTSPIVGWLRALGRHAHHRCGGPGIGAVGMCFSGGFALAMAADDTLLVPVLSQPGLPLPVTRRRRASLDISAADLARVKARCAGGLEVIGLRFRGDLMCPAARFDRLRRELGDAFIAVELEDSDANPHGLGTPHGVLTEHLVDEPGSPTRAALDLVVDHLRRKLADGADRAAPTGPSEVAGP